jgi:hypothetical protein
VQCSSLELGVPSSFETVHSIYCLLGEMSHNSMDYFATLGRREGELTCKTLLPIGADSDDQTQSVHPSDVWSDAITDIEIIYKGNGCDSQMILSAFSCGMVLSRYID